METRRITETYHWNVERNPDDIYLIIYSDRLVAGSEIDCRLSLRERYDYLRDENLAWLRHSNVLEYSRDIEQYR